MRSFLRTVAVVAAASIALSAAASTLGCRRVTPKFGEACVDDSQCLPARLPDGDEPVNRNGENFDDDLNLVCDPVRHQCVPRSAPPPIPGLTCEDALVLELAPAVGELVGGAIEGELNPAASPSPPALAAEAGGCAESEGRWLYVRVDVPAPMGLRVRAVGAQGKITLAVLDEQCGARFEHACAQGVDEVVLPYVDGTIVVAVDASAGARAGIEVEQIHCPLGFIPSDAGVGPPSCLGFVELPGPAPRTGHQLTAIDDDLVIVSAGRGAQGEYLQSQLFSRQALRWVDLQQGQAREGHAAAVIDGFLFLVGGNTTVGSESIEPNSEVFFPDVEPREARGIVGGTLTAMTQQRPLLFIGGVKPVEATFFGESGDTCTDSFDCEATFECVALVEDGDATSGVCICLLDDCSRLPLENPTWLQREFAPDELNFRTRHAAVDIDEDADGALVIITGGVTPEVDAAAGEEVASFAYFEEVAAFVPLPFTPAQRRDAFGIDVGGGRILLIGGRVLADADAEGAEGAEGAETPTNLVELWSPLLGTPPSTTFLSRARADHAGAVVTRKRQVIAVGGVDDSGNALATTELVDMDTGAVSAGPTLPFPLVGARAATFGNGDVIVAGGRTAPLPPAEGEGEGEGDLVDVALLLIETPPTLVAPRAGDGFALPDRPGDTCDDAVPLIAGGAPASVGDQGTIDGNTLGYSDDVNVFDDSGCQPTVSPAPEIFYRVDVPAGLTLHLSLVDPIGAGDLVLLVYDECPIELPCFDGVDLEFSAPETLAVVAPGGAGAPETTTLYVAVDGFDLDVPFNYRLEWSVSE